MHVPFQRGFRIDKSVVSALPGISATAAAIVAMRLSLDFAMNARPCDFVEAVEYLTPLLPDAHNVVPPT